MGISLIAVSSTAARQHCPSFVTGKVHATGRNDDGRRCSAAVTIS
jgi:hypothetical protein